VARKLAFCSLWVRVGGERCGTEFPPHIGLCRLLHASQVDSDTGGEAPLSYFLKFEERSMKYAARVISLALLGSSFAFALPASALSAPKYEFPENSTPGVEMVLKESTREKRGKVTWVYYNLSTKGLTPGQTLNLYQWVWTLSDGLLSQAGFQVEPDGKVICSKPPEGGVSGEESKHWCQGTLEETTLAAVGFQRGQAFRIGLISTDGQQKVFAEITPFPIESEDRGCRLLAE
jgi:hypothetical protein